MNLKLGLAIFLSLNFGSHCFAAEQEGAIPEAPVMEEGYVPGVPKIALTPEQLALKVAYRKARWARRQALAALDKKLTELETDLSDVKLKLAQKPSAKNEQILLESLEEIQQLRKETILEQLEILETARESLSNFMDILEQSPLIKMKIQSDLLNEYEYMTQDFDALDKRFNELEWQQSLLLSPEEKEKMEQEATEEETLQAQEGQPEQKEKEEKVKGQQPQSGMSIEDFAESVGMSPEAYRKSLEQDKKPAEGEQQLVPGLESYREVQAVREKKLAQLDEKLHQLKQDHTGFGLKLLNSEEVSSEDTQNIQSWKESLEQARKLLAKNIAHQLEIQQAIRADAEKILDYLTVLYKSQTEAPKDIKDQYMDVLGDSIEAGKRIKFLENELESFVPEQKQEQETKLEQSNPEEGTPSEAPLSPQELQAKIAYRKARLARNVRLRELDKQRAELIKDREDFKAKLAQSGAKSVQDEEHWNDALREIDELMLENINEEEEILNAAAHTLSDRYHELEKLEASAQDEIEYMYIGTDAKVITAKMKSVVSALPGNLPLVKWGALAQVTKDAFRESYFSPGQKEAGWEPDDNDDLQTILKIAQMSLDYPPNQAEQKEKEEKVKKLILFGEEHTPEQPNIPEEPEEVEEEEEEIKGQAQQAEEQPEENMYPDD